MRSLGGTACPVDALDCVLELIMEGSEEDTVLDETLAKRAGVSKVTANRYAEGIERDEEG